MDIRIFVKRSAAYLAAFLVSGVLLLVLLLGSNALVHDAHQLPVREILLALVVGVFFHPLKVVIQRVFDRYVYRQPYDYQRTIREASRALSATIELPVLLGHVGAIVRETLRPEGQAVYLRDEEDGEFRRGTASGSIEFPETLAAVSPLLRMAARERKPVFRDALGSDDGAVARDFARIGADVVVPLLEDEQVIGLLAVGPKRSGDPYFSDDADLLGTLADQSAVAVRNAEAHEHVLEVNEHIQKILSTIESGVVAVSAKGRVTLSNRAVEIMTGAATGTLRGQPFHHLPAPLSRLIEATLADGHSRSQTEIALPDAAGQIVPLMCSTSPLRGLHGAVVGAVTVLSDLSRLKELEQEKRRAERLASLEAIASGMVHEIRNPLVAIKTFTQLLPARFDDAVFRESFARVSDREISRIEALLERFRTLASASAQPMEPVDVGAPLQAALELLRPQIDARRIHLRHVADGTCRPIIGNASQLEQLFLNLCLNALEAMEPGGELTIRVADLCEAGGTTLLIEVSDTGPGIAEDILPNIFNPFVTTKARGSGLGLAICRSIADAHRAALRARNNTERRGATFTLEFPVSSERTISAPA
jgi:PAS domain S-box-containing protein